MPTSRLLRPGTIVSALDLLRRTDPRELLRRKIVLEVDDFRLEVPRDRLWAFLGGKYYERNVRHWWRRFLARQERAVVYDAGAHAGYYALAAASAGAAHVYAFEPAPATSALLERNVARNRFSQVRTFALALSDHDGHSDLRLFTASGNNTLATDALPHLVPRGRARVVVRRLDTLVESERLAPPSLFKLDVEGSELAALRGARDVLGRHKPVVFMEYWHEGALNAGHALDDLERELQSHGYRLFGLSEDLDDFRLHPRASWAGTGIGNVVAVPPGVEPS